ncbi:MAG: glycoside hydrolase family 23 [Lacrimispora sp.]|uniref:glycoside hydrolase family 23 n=1 Tax=Lacrimispora sp. TaxID=2719234 RepID=UPI0039E67EE5
MNKIQKKRTLLQEINRRYIQEQKKLKKKGFRLKTRLILTIALPILLVLISAKAAQTFIRIKVRELFAKPLPEKVPDEPSQPVAVPKVPVETEVLHPEPVSEEK